VLFALAVVAKVLWVEGWPGWVLVGAGAVVELGESYLWVRWSRRRRVQVGTETLVGAEAVVVTDCRPDGQVRLQGEIWQARCAEGAAVGQQVVVERVDGLTLTVRRAS
jgi:membrane protein implicated in regulation of membrane protease activity